MTASPKVPVPCEATPIQITGYAKGQGWRDTRVAAFDQGDRERWAACTFPALAGFRVFSCGVYTAAAGHYWKRQGLPEGVLIYCTAGRGFYEQDGQRWEVGPGDLLYCPPESAHSYGAAKQDPWTICWMHLSGPDLPHHERLAGLGRGGPVRRIGVQPGIIERFHHLVSRCHPEYDDARFLAIQAEGAGILAAIAITPESMENLPEQTVVIQRIQELMEERLEHPFDLGSFAREAGYDACYFSRLFKKVTGDPPGVYFGRRRISRAAALLTGSTLTVCEIALRLGYSSAYYFSNAFKKTTGQSPSEYRQAANGMRK